MINCPYCGKLTDPRLNACPHCHAPMRRGAGSPAPEAAAPSPFAARPSAACPNCRSPINQGDIICIKCGTNLLTGQQIIAQEAPAVARRSGGSIARFLTVVLVLLLIAGSAGGAYFALVYNEPVTKAKRLAAQGNLLDAVSTLSVYTQTNAQNAEAFTLLGRYEYRSQRYPEAAAALSAAAKLQPKDIDLNYQAAAAASRTQGGGLNDQIAAFRRITENHPDDVEAGYLLALALGTAGEFREQQEVLERVVATAPEKAIAGRYLGIAKALNGDLEGGEALVAQGPDGEEKALAQGLLLNLQGKSDEAATQLQSGLRNGAPEIKGLAGTQLGLLLMSQGKFEDAVAILSEASDAPNAPPAASFFYALCLQNAGLDTEALTEFADLASGDGEYAADAAAQMAQIYIQQENPVKAEESLRRASTGGNKSAKIHTLQGTLAAQAGELNQAQQSFRMALQLDPEYAPAHLELGLVHIAGQRLQDGVASLKKYLELAGDAKDARAPEIELLVNQLEQAILKGGDTGGQQANTTAQPAAQES
jgi:tetratricopeptide (TPR) repeat protein